MAKVACHRPREDTDGEHRLPVEWGVGAPHQYSRVNKKRTNGWGESRHWPPLPFLFFFLLLSNFAFKVCVEEAMSHSDES